MSKVTLHVRVEPNGEKDDRNNVIGEVKRGDEVLYTERVITGNTIETVSDVKKGVALDIEIWAVNNTDFEPTEDALPAL